MHRARSSTSQTTRQQCVAIAANRRMIWYTAVRLMLVSLRASLGEGLTRGILFGTAIAEEIAVFGVSDVVTTVTDFRANRTNAHAIDHVAGVAVIPVLIHKFFLSNGEGAQFVAQIIFVRILGATVIFIMDNFVDPVTVGHIVRRLSTFPWWTCCAILACEKFLRTYRVHDICHIV